MQILVSSPIKSIQHVYSTSGSVNISPVPAEKTVLHGKAARDSAAPNVLPTIVDGMVTGVQTSANNAKGVVNFSCEVVEYV